MRIDRHHQWLLPTGAGRKAGPVAAVEPVATVFSTRRWSTGSFGARVVLENGPVDRRVRQALEAYLSHREIPNESVTLLQGVDVYV